MVWMTSFTFLFVSLLFNTSRFHAAVRLFCKKSQGTSKCGKDISDTLHVPVCSCATFLFLTHFDVVDEHKKSVLCGKISVCRRLLFSIRLHLPSEYKAQNLLKRKEKCLRLLGRQNLV